MQVPEIEAYWKTSWTSRIPFFGSLMPRDRFQEIFWLLHVSHPDPAAPVKKIDKIHMLLDVLLTKFQHHFRIRLQTKQWWDTVAGLDLRSILHRNL